MGRNSYLGGSTIVYPGKSWGSPDHVETPAVIWGRHQRHLEMLAQAELDDQRQTYIAMIISVVDHLESLRTISWYISKSRNYEAMDKAAQSALILMDKTRAMISDVTNLMKGFDQAGPKLRRYGKIISDIGDQLDTDYLQSRDGLYYWDFDWETIYRVTRGLNDIQERNIRDRWFQELEILDGVGFDINLKSMLVPSLFQGRR